MNMQRGGERPWDSLTEEEKKSGSWIRVPDGTGGERARPASLLAFDPSAPLRIIGTAAGDVTIRQRIGGTLFVRWADGGEENYPVGFSIDHVEADVRRRLGAESDR